MPLSTPYPPSRRARDAWIVGLRPPRPHPADPLRPHGFFVEQERAASGQIVSVATILLTNRECPWRCVMCDLWKTTVSQTVPPGAIPTQIQFALGQLLSQSARSSDRDTDQMTAIRQIKLYNGGSFFDPAAVPPPDYPEIASRVSGFERVIVECHPAFVRDSSLRFQDLLSHHSVSLEVAMGLETVHPGVLEALNKGMTLEQFSRAAEFLKRHGIALRAFVLVKPPFLSEAEALHWAERSVDFAFDNGATAVSLIPTRAGNGAMEALVAQGHFTPPKLRTLEAAHNYGIGLGRGRVFADLWDLETFADCRQCFSARHARLRGMNLEQTVLSAVACHACGGG